MGPAPIALGAAAIGGLLTLATLPALLAPTTTIRDSRCQASATGDVERIAATIRQLESGGDYTARAPGSSASGAYQFIDESWAGYGGYPRAYLAPPPVQDAKAAEYIAIVLAGNGGDVSIVPVAWYIGHVPPSSSPEWDTVPAPEAGNRLTPREYQTRWMDTFRSLADDAGASSPPGANSDERPPRCVGGQGQTFRGGWALPGPRDVLDRTADQLDDPHHDYPAWDWAIPTGTPIYAVRGGTVIVTTDNPRNCAGGTTCEACGLGVTIADDQGATWTYCHGSTHHVATGDTVSAGQQVLASGNTGNSTGPHLHLNIRVGGVDRCPQTLISSLYLAGDGIDPAHLPIAGCSY